MTGAIVIAIALPLIGAAVRRVTGGGPRFLLGVGTAGFVLYVAMLLRVPPTPVAIGLVVTAVLTLALIRGARATPPARSSVPATIVTIAPVVCLLFISAIVPLRDFDGRAFWMLKTKAIATEQQVDGPLFQGERGHSPKNEYPLLIPIVGAAVMVTAGDTDDLQILWLYVLALGSFALHARRIVGPWPAALIPWLPQFAIAPEGGALTAYNDIFVAAFAGCAFFELVRRESPLRFGLWMSFLILTKYEGLPFSIVLLAAAAVIWRRQAWMSIVPVAIAALTLLVWKARVEPTDDDRLMAAAPTLFEHLDRLYPALSGFVSHAIDLDRWGLFWIAVVVAAIIGIRADWRQTALPVFVIVAMTAVYVAAYMVTAWTVEDHVASSADRLLMHFVGPAVMIIGALGRNRYSRDPRRLTEASPEPDLPHPDPLPL